MASCRWQRGRMVSSLNNMKEGKRTRFRFMILAAVFVNVVINYMDRTNISVAGPYMMANLQLNSVQLGLIFSAFGWTYVALQIPGGILADRFSPRVVYTFCLICWSLVTIAQVFAKGFASLLGCRMAVGIFEAPAYPTNNRIVTSWFPNHERASAIGVYTSGQFLGLALLAPVLTSLQHYTGWKGLFIITGIAGIAWGTVWYFFYRDPGNHPGANEKELEYIEKGGGLTNRKKDSIQFKWSDLRQVFIYRKLWGIYIGQFCLGATMWFFLTWFPTYLVKYLGFDFLQSGFYTSIPYLSAFCGILLSGFLSDYLLKKGIAETTARKIPVVVGLLLTVFIIGANYTEKPAWIIAFMCIAFFGNGIASITWIFVSLLAPKHLLGLTGGVFNFIGGLSAVLIPLMIGLLVRGGSFTTALLTIGLIGIAGALSYIFLVGKVERIQIVSKDQ
jgi:ACS family D-galactonate transporter-like MFS transporter